MGVATRVNGRITICTGGVCTPGETAGATRASTSTIESMASARTPGKTADSTLVSGSMGSNMAREATDRLMGRRDEAFGKTAKESSGKVMINNNSDNDNEILLMMGRNNNSVAIIIYLCDIVSK